jgi:hypothetical protein
MPKAFVLENDCLDLDEFKLTENKLRKYGELVSKIRKVVREKALEMDGKSLENIHEKQN